MAELLKVDNSLTNVDVAWHDQPEQTSENSSIQVSFRRILIGYTALIVISIAGLLILIASWQHREHLVETKSDASRHMARNLARSIEGLIAEDKLVEVRRLINRAVDSDRSCQYIRVLDSKNEEIAARWSENVGPTFHSFERKAPGKAESHTNNGLSSDLLFVEAQMFNASNQEIGRVIASVSLEDAYARWWSTTLYLLIATAFSGAFCMGVTLWLSRKMTAPVERLIEGAQQLARCNFDMRVAPTRQRELSTLIRSFNSLAKALADSTVSQNYVNSVFDSMSEGLVIVDADCKIETVNPAFSLLADRPVPRLEQEPIVEFLLGSDGSPVNVDLLSPRVCEQLAGEYLLQQVSGTPVPVSISCTRRKDGIGNNLGYVLVFQDIREQQQAQREMERLANVDPLTNTLNRRAFLRGFDQIHARDLAPCDAMALVMVDIDYFKRINDTLGHLAGDDVLSRMGQILNAAVKDKGEVCRYGGEEFCVLLNRKTEQEAIRWCEELRQQISETRFTSSGRRIDVTCTFGLAASRLDQVDITELIDRADHVLASTKRSGRNRVGSESNTQDELPELADSIPLASMAVPAATINRTTTVRDAIIELQDASVEWLLIVDELGEYFGCLSQQDLLQHETTDPGISVDTIADKSAPTFAEHTDFGVVSAFVERCKPPVVIVLAANENHMDSRIPLGILPQNWQETAVACHVSGAAHLV